MSYTRQLEDKAGPVNKDSADGYMNRDHDNRLDADCVDRRVSSLPHDLLQRRGAPGAPTRRPLEVLGAGQEGPRSVLREEPLIARAGLRSFGQVAEAARLGKFQQGPSSQPLVRNWFDQVIKIAWLGTAVHWLGRGGVFYQSSGDPVQSLSLSTQLFIRSET